MIIRIVKMTFEPSGVDTFVQIFVGAQKQIEACKGCRGVDLTRDVLQPNVFITISMWDSLADLDAYRHSELFQSTWAKTKLLFVERPDAWSIEKIM